MVIGTSKSWQKSKYRYAITLMSQTDTVTLGKQKESNIKGITPKPQYLTENGDLCATCRNIIRSVDRQTRKMIYVHW